MDTKHFLRCYCVLTPLVLPINFTWSRGIHQNRWKNLLLARKAHKGQAFVHAALYLLENSSCLHLLTLPFQDAGSISWFPSLCFHSTLYLPSSQLLPHYTEIIYLCVCLPSYSTISRGQGTCITHLPTPRRNVAQQSTNTELNCKAVRLASLPGKHPAHAQPKLCSTTAPPQSYQWLGPGESVCTRVQTLGSSHSPAVCPWTRHLYLWVLIYKAGRIQYHLTCRVVNACTASKPTVGI